MLCGARMCTLKELCNVVNGSIVRTSIVNEFSCLHVRVFVCKHSCKSL